MTASEEQRPYAVVILNWNGALDTIACLESLRGASRGAVPIVVDNGSTDDSASAIQRAAQATWVHDMSAAAAGDALIGRTFILPSPENLGFAAGCNLGLRFAAKLGLQSCVFLNNDTLVEPGALDLLVAGLDAQTDCFACLPMIVVHGTDRVWNCGGMVSGWGFRRYFHSGRPRSEVAPLGPIRCSFFTGCCFSVKTSRFVARGGFTERFFFGEEDFELSLWMKGQGLAAWCLPAAVVQHKVSASFVRASENHGAPRLFVYYLNRMIHMRLRLGRILWAGWLLAYLAYTAGLLLRGTHLPRSQVPNFLARLVRDASRMDGVGRTDFERLMRGAEPLRPRR